MTVNISLKEANKSDSDPPNKEYAPDQPAATVVPQQTVDITYGQQDFAKSWKWTIPYIWIPHGPYRKLFEYSIQLDMNDEFMNGYPLGETFVYTYPVPDFSKVYVEVGVSELKKVANAVALGLTVDAAALLVAAAIAALIPFFGWVVAGALAAAASAVEAVAIGVGQIALDPPAPDPHFVEAVIVEPVRVPSVLRDHSEWGALAPLIDSAGIIAAVINAMSTVEGRLLGAKEAKSQDGFTLQEEAYRTLQRSLQEASEEITEHAERAEGALKPEMFTVDAIRATLSRLRKDGIPKELRAAWTEYGGSPDTLAVLEPAMLDSQVVGGFFLGDPFRRLATLLRNLVNLALEHPVPDYRD